MPADLEGSGLQPSSNLPHLLPSWTGGLHPASLLSSSHSLPERYFPMTAVGLGHGGFGACVCPTPWLGCACSHVPGRGTGSVCVFVQPRLRLWARRAPLVRAPAHVRKGTEPWCVSVRVCAVGAPTCDGCCQTKPRWVVGTRGRVLVELWADARDTAYKIVQY